MMKVERSSFHSPLASPLLVVLPELSHTLVYCASTNTDLSRASDLLACSLATKIIAYSNSNIREG